jgi:hypothetical protein
VTASSISTSCARRPVESAAADEEPTPRPLNLKRVLTEAIRSTAKDDGWSNLAEVGSYLSTRHPAFDPRDYGHGKLGERSKAARRA